MKWLTLICTTHHLWKDCFSFPKIKKIMVCAFSGEKAPQSGFTGKFEWENKVSTGWTGIGRVYHN